MSCTRQPILTTMELDRQTRAFAFIAIITGAIRVAQVCAGLTMHGDVFWHEAFGPIILAHGVIHNPVLTYTTHRRFVEPEWLFDIILHGFVVLFGPLTGARIMTTLLAAVAYTSICLYALRTAGLSVWRIVSVIVIVMVSLTTFVGMHPQEFGYALWALVLIVSVRARNNHKLLLLLIPLAGIWVNVDGSFLLVLVLLIAEMELSAVYKVLPGLRKYLPAPLPLRTVVAVIVGVLIVVSASPYGIVALIRSQVSASFWPPMRTIGIWSPFATASVLIVVVVFGALVMSVFGLITRRGGLAPLAAIAGIIVGMTSTILLPYGLLAAAVAVGSLQGRNAGKRDNRYYVEHLLIVPIMLAALALMWGPTMTPQSLAPTEAQSHLPPKSDRIFTTYYWGDWLVYLHRPAFIYGETFQWVDTPILTEYREMKTLTINPTPILAKYHIHYALLPRNSAMRLYLEHADGWHVAWQNKTTTLLKQGGK